MLNLPFLSICRYHVIANPLEGKLTMTKAVFIVILIWCYAIPWALFPYFKVWGRFVPGKFEYTTLFVCLSFFVCFFLHRKNNRERFDLLPVTFHFLFPFFSIFLFFFLNFYSQRVIWHRAHSIIWPIHSIIDYLLVHCLHLVTAYQWHWSSTTTAKLWSMSSAMKKHYVHRRKKWMWNH